MNLLILTNHPKQQLELARKSALPQNLYFYYVHYLKNDQKEQYSVTIEKVQTAISCVFLRHF